MQTRARQDAFRLAYLQLIAVIILALISLAIKGTTYGLSTLVGGLAYSIPNLYFVWRLFAQGGARAVKKILIAFYLGETVKLLASATLFVLAVKYLPIVALPALLGFIGAIVVFWIASAFYISYETRGV